MKKAFFILSFLLFATFGFAQQAINQTLIDYFDNLDKAQVPTGILVEQGFPMYNLEEYKGQVLTDSNKIDADLFGWLYMGLALGNVNENTVIPDPQAYANMYKSTYNGGDLPIAVVNYRYNYIKATALSQNLVYISNGKMYDTPNRTASPYGQTNLFIASPMSPISNTASVTFSIPSNLYFSNQTAALQSVQVDLGDGSGYRTTGLGQTLTAYYGTNGEKALKVKCTLTDGQVFESHSVLQVQDENRAVAGFRSPPTSYNVTPDLTQTDIAGCTLNYFFHCPQQGLQKPFVFIEGFDPTGDQTFNAMILRLSLQENLVPKTQASMFQRLYDEGYDLIYVDFTNGAGDIPSNAQVVKNVIRRVNALKAQNGSTTKTRVLGASMGGVVGKWAIREMEIANENHDIDKFITFDSPMRGANVPMGIQFMIKDLDTRTVKVKLGTIVGQITIQTKELKNFIPAIAGIKALLTAPAAKQMLFYSAFTPSGNPREFHDDFYARLAALGDLQVDYSVVSNGSSINQPQLLNAGELYASVTGLGRTSVRVIGRSSIDVAVALRLSPFAIPASGNGSVYTGSIAMLLPGEGNPFIDVSSQINSTVSNLKPLDSAPGGFSNFGFPSRVSNISFGGITIRGDFGTKTKGLWCFVPTFSALDIAEPTNVNQNFDCTSTNTNADRCVGSTDALAFSSDIGAVGTAGGFAHNQDHVSINQRNAIFLLNQLAGSSVLNNLTGNLTRTYNFGISNQTPSSTVLQPTSTPNVLARGLTVEGTGRLWVNRSGKINFTDENNLLNRSNSTFDLAIRRGTTACNTTNTSVIIRNGGVMHLGDPSVSNTGVAHIETGATVEIQADGTLQIDGNSQLIIENGGRLIINAGANINLVGSESTIYVKNGGELVINGNMNFSGNGFFQFDAGHVLTLGTDLVLRGSGKTTRMIRLNTPAPLTTNTLRINGRGFNLSDALIEYGNRCQINVTNGVANLNTIANASFRGTPSGGSNSTALNFTNVTNVAVQTSDFEGLTSGVNVSGNGNLLRNIDIRQSNFNLVNYGVSIISTNSISIPATRNFMIVGCNFNYVVGNIVLSGGKACRFQNLERNAIELALNTFTGYEEGNLWEDITAIEIKNTTLIFNEDRILNFKTGISAEKDANNNLFLDNIEINNCEIGVNIVGGDYSAYTNLPYGRIQMNCARLINNGTGIKGTDVHFNQGGFEDRLGTNNVFQNRVDGLLFDICYNSGGQRWITASDNFWVGGFTNMRFNIAFKIWNYCQANGISLRSCNDLTAPPTNCLQAQSNCCNVDNIVSNGDNSWSTIFFQCLVSNTNPTTNTTTVNKADKQEEIGDATVKSSNKNFSIYPNPANETVNLAMPNGTYHLRVLNAIGQTIFAQNTEGVLSVGVATWTNGIYYFELTDKAANKQQHSKIVVQH